MMNVATARWPVYPSTETIEQTGCRTDAKKAKFDYTTRRTEIVNDCKDFILLSQLVLLKEVDRLSFWRNPGDFRLPAMISST
jgi:hypothetical protein